MTGIIKTDQLQGAQSSTITIPSGNNLTVGGAFTSQGIDDNANATAIKIDASEKVSLGGSTAVTSDSKVAIHGGNLELTTAGARYWIPRASDGVLTGSLYSPSGSVVRLSGAGTGLGTIEFEPRSSNGVIARVTGDGLCFGSDTAAANALNDYEEGTWTPTLTGYSGGDTQTYQYQQGNYTKIGRMVFANYRVRLTAKGNISGSYVHIKGLPFSNAATLAGTGNIHYVQNLGTARDMLAWEIGGGTTDRGWLTYTDSTTSYYLSTSDIGNTTGFVGMLKYITD